MKVTSIIAYVLTVIGALVWLLVGLFSFNPVTAIFGNGMVARIIYSVVGVAGIWLLFTLILGVPFGNRRAEA